MTFAALADTEQPDTTSRCFGSGCFSRDKEFNDMSNQVLARRLTLLLGTSALAATLPIVNAEAIEWSGQYQQEFALATQPADQQRLVKYEHLLQLETSGDIGDLQYHFDGRYRYDHKTRLDKEQQEFQFRDAYIEFESGDTSFRLGKQTIVWGQADGIRLLDVINPVNYREFILDDYDNSRIARTAVTAIVPIGHGSDLTVSLIPEHSFNRYPDDGQRFTLNVMPELPANTDITLNPVEEPKAGLNNTDIAIRYAAFLGSWDITINYLRHFNNDPSVAIKSTPSGIEITPSHKRNTIIGGSANNAFGNFVLRSELAWNSDIYYQSSVSEKQYQNKSRELQYVIALDYSGISNNLISGQWFRWQKFGYANDLAEDPVRNTLTLLWRSDFMNQTLQSELLAIRQSGKDSSGLLRASLRYEAGDNLILKTGLDVFYGNSDGLYGQFNEKDQLSAGLEISF